MAERVDWEGLRQYILRDETADFLAELSAQMQAGTNHFKVLQRGLQTYCFTQVTSATVRPQACMINVCTAHQLLSWAVG
jgi:hypothetical protein